jgi:uncharacterized FAD-dependent dehydrogenase
MKILLVNRKLKMKFDIVIVGSGPAGLGAAFELAENSNKSILILDKSKISSGGLRNDCKQNYRFPIGFPLELWNEAQADSMLNIVEKHLEPNIQKINNIDIYKQRANKLNTELIEIKQAHVGTDKSVNLIKNLLSQLSKKNVALNLNCEVLTINELKNEIVIDYEEDMFLHHETIEYENLILAPGRAGANWLRDLMKKLNISFSDNIVDIGIRVETKEENYPIVKDFYDPKFLFPNNVRTFCTNSGKALVVKEKYKDYYSVNGHSLSNSNKSNNLVNFALLKTFSLTDPVSSGHEFAEILGKTAMSLSGGKPMMQRIGDFRLGKRSKKETFNSDLYNFEPTLKDAIPGDISLAIPAKIMRHLWSSLKILDTIIPGILHPSTIMYYPEIKTYANRPKFIDENFRVKNNIFMIGDGAGTSRGITAAWASGIRAARGILN